MAYDIQWQSKAVRQFEKIKEHSTRKAIRDAVTGLTHFPHCSQIKVLRNHEYDYRLRVGRFRVLFNVFDGIKVIRIEEVKKRDEHTY